MRPSNGWSAGEAYESANEAVMARVLVCAGSRGYIAALQLALEHEGDITVAAACVTVADAMKLLRGSNPTR